MPEFTGDNEEECTSSTATSTSAAKLNATLRLRTLPENKSRVKGAKVAQLIQFHAERSAANKRAGGGGGGGR